MAKDELIRPENAGILVILTAALSFTLTVVVASFSADIVAIQNVLEVAAVILPGWISVLAYEAVRGEDVFDDSEILLFLGLFTVFAVMLPPLVPASLLSMFELTPLRAAVIGAVQASMAILVAWYLERTTELV